MTTTPSDEEYKTLFNNCTIDASHTTIIDGVIDKRLVENKATYLYISYAVKYGLRYADYYTYNLDGFCFVREPEYTDQAFDTSSHWDNPLNRYRLFLTAHPESEYAKLSPIVRDGSSGDMVPWYFIGCLHYMETSSNFTKHLHNGDPLQSFTTHVPANRPQLGHKPPFTFVESAIDAIKFEKINRETNWSLPVILRWFEKFNGTGYYRFQHINSPYLWSYSNQYTKGKYGSDGKFDKTLVSKQAGCATILKRMEDRKLITIPRQ